MKDQKDLEFAKHYELNFVNDRRKNGPEDLLDHYEKRVLPALRSNCCEDPRELFAAAKRSYQAGDPFLRGSRVELASSGIFCRVTDLRGFARYNLQTVRVGRDIAASARELLAADHWRRHLGGDLRGEMAPLFWSAPLAEVRKEVAGGDMNANNVAATLGLLFRQPTELVLQEIDATELQEARVPTSPDSLGNICFFSRRSKNHLGTNVTWQIIEQRESVSEFVHRALPASILGNCSVLPGQAFTVPGPDIGAMIHART